MTLFANTGIRKKAIHAKVRNSQPSLPALEIEGCKQALKAPLTAFLLLFPSERCTKDWLHMFAQVGELRNKQIGVFLIFSQNVLGNWWPSFNLSLKWNISAITTQSHSKNFKLGSSKECQDFKLQCITSCQGRSKRRGYRRGKKKERAKLGVIRSRNKDIRAENTTFFSPISLSWTLQSLSYFCFLHFYMFFFPSGCFFISRHDHSAPQFRGEDSYPQAAFLRTPSRSLHPMDLMEAGSVLLMQQQHRSLLLSALQAQGTEGPLLRKEFLRNLSVIPEPRPCSRAQ